MDKKTRLNMAISLLLQIVTIISSFIIPKQILLSFGSEVNGLVNSITQFLNYISLIEGGLGSVLMTALYQPLNENDFEKVSRIIVAGNNFFKKIAKIFLIYLFAVSVVYPLIVKTKFSFSYICTLSLILGISLFIQYYFSIIWRLMLQADRKVYISAGVQIVTVTLNTILTVAIVRIYPSIHVIKLISAGIFVIQPLIYNLYIEKNYEINKKAVADNAALEHRWDGFGINLAAFFNGNTDVIVLSLLSTLSNVSIYGVYSLVVTGIKSIITSISAGIVPSLGREYSLGNKNKLKTIFSKYENLILFIVFTIYSCAVLLIVPFVINYTSGVTDANYRQPVFSILLILSYSIFCIREPYVNMAYVSNSYKKISKYAYIEALINVCASFLFVKKFGLNGVALGTFASMSYRTCMQIIFLKKNIIYRSPIVFGRKFLIYLTTTTVGVIIAKNIVILSGENGWGEWLLKAIITTIIIILWNAVAYISIWFYECKFKKGDKIYESFK